MKTGKHGVILSSHWITGGFIMNWNRDKSVRLSKCCVWLFMVIFVLICFFAPQIFSWLISDTTNSKAHLGCFLATVYTGAVPALIALLDLNKLLKNISCGEVFIDGNVTILRRLSWCCIAAGLICLVSMIYYPPFLVISGAAGFIGLILRVVKNVFAQAVLLKNENDYTI